MLLGDLGAEVIRVERIGVTLECDPTKDPLVRNRRSVSLNLEIALRLVSTADVFIEGYRPAE
jgi:alpha-methylacyl-CoA racemase